SSNFGLPTSNLLRSSVSGLRSSVSFCPRSTATRASKTHIGYPFPSPVFGLPSFPVHRPRSTDHSSRHLTSGGRLTFGLRLPAGQGFWSSVFRLPSSLFHLPSPVFGLRFPLRLRHHRLHLYPTQVP